VLFLLSAKNRHTAAQCVHSQDLRNVPLECAVMLWRRQITVMKTIIFFDKRPTQVHRLSDASTDSWITLVYPQLTLVVIVNLYSAFMWSHPKRAQTKLQTDRQRKSDLNSAAYVRAMTHTAINCGNIMAQLSCAIILPVCHSYLR